MLVEDILGWNHSALNLKPNLLVSANKVVISGSSYIPVGFFAKTVPDPVAEPNTIGVVSKAVLSAENHTT